MYIPSEVWGESQLVKKISVLSLFEILFYFIFFIFIFFPFLMELLSIKTTIEKSNISLSFVQKKKKEREREKEQHCE